MLISSPANPRSKAIRALRQRKARERTGLCFVEGIRIVTEAIQMSQPHPLAPPLLEGEGDGGRGQVQIESLVVAPDLLTSPHMQELINQQKKRGIPILEVTRAVFESISSKEGPQGIGAVVRQQWQSLDQIVFPPLQSGGGLGWGLWIALDAAQDPGNIGTILRTSDAVGGAGLILLGHAADPYDPSAVRASMGALFSQRLVRASWDEFIAWKRAQHVTLVGTSDRAERDYTDVTYTSPLVLLMGSEQKGLSREQQAACDLIVKIPMVGRSDSLNLAVATAVVLYEIFNQHRHHPSATE